MNVAFLVQAYQDPLFLNRFIERLVGYGDVYLHIDAKVNAGPFHEIIGSKVFYIKNRHIVRWGGKSQIDAFMELVKSANENKDYDYYSHHSDADYPTKNLGEFLTFLQSNKGKNFIECHPIPEHNTPRLTDFHLTDFYHNRKKNSKKDKLIRYCDKILKALPLKRKMVNSWIPYKGLGWFTITQELALDILNHWESSPETKRFFKFVHIPEEHYYSSFIMNSGYKKTISAFGNLRYLDWTRRNGFFPDTLLAKNYEEIITSEATFFARKFNGIDTQILDRLDSYSKNTQ